ncbi:MAG: hypothetical protein EU530_09285 [Promethearchaeota archaeon]|nr:MAG: hypothetical protein EU530_09285 [Candidatus Lokiarchaeota archaeon]
MKRYASIDFMRGIAILLMLILHSIGDALDVDGLISQVDYLPMINIIALVVLPFLGGLAGLFLLVSSIANMISMQKQLMQGRSAGMLALRQVITGFIIYLFAMLTESTTGYWGGIGDIARRLDLPLTVNWIKVFTQWGTIEAIHTIALCIIVNGLVHGIISVKGLWKKPKIQMAIYAALAVIVLASTTFVWKGISNVYPGFPWGIVGDYYINSDGIIAGYTQYQPHLLNSRFIDIVKGWFFGLWAAPMEPLFPYLAVTFIGSIIGIAVVQPEKAIFKGFMKIMLMIAVGMFLIGAVGIIIMMIKIIPQNFDDAVGIYRLISFHRHWAPDYPQYGSYLTWWSWLWQFCSVTGWGLMATLAMLYIVEFRGKGKRFADKTKFVRRFGFTAFSNYNQQYIYTSMAFWVPQLFFGTGSVATWLNSKLGWWQSGLGAYDHTMWFGTFVQIGFTLLTYHVVMRLWEKANYRGSLEWFMGTIGYYIVPVKKPESLRAKKWYEKGDLAVEEAFYNAEWVNIVEETEEYHRKKRDSRIVLLFAIAAFCVPLFIPFTVGWLFVTIKSIKTEGKNKQNKTALILCSIGTVLTVLFSVALFIFTPDMLGFHLL